MIDSLPTPYMTDHPINRTVMAAVEAGLRKASRPAIPASWVPEPAISYGVLRGTADIFRRCQYAELNWFHLDLGYWGRGHFEGYYRLSRNGTQDPFLRRDYGRITLPELADWKPGTGPIVICPPTHRFAQHQPIDIIHAQEWESTILMYLESLTDRKIVVRRKDESEIESIPEDPWCVVSYNSNICLDMLISGTPSISTGPGLLNRHCALLEQIEDRESLISIDRNNILVELSWGQFTLDELRAGVPWSL